VSRKTSIANISPAGLNERGEDHQVVTMTDGCGSYRRTPCLNCPWRVDAVGEFPAEAFRHSARTAYDMAQETFACHDSGTKKPATCAGFLLRGADHNLGVRLKRMLGQCQDVNDGGHELHESYRAMAIANGVAADDPVLAGRQIDIGKAVEATVFAYGVVLHPGLANRHRVDRQQVDNRQFAVDDFLKLEEQSFSLFRVRGDGGLLQPTRPLSDCCSGWHWKMEHPA